MSAWSDEVTAIKAEFPQFEVKRYSDDKFWSWMKAHLLKWAAATTVGYTIYIDDIYYDNDRGAEILKHECAHVRDWDRWHILMHITYFLCLPTVFTLRAVWEWHGYRENLRSTYEAYKTADPKYREYIHDYYSQWVASEFCGWNYLFMFPFRNFMYNKCRDFIKSLGP